MESIESQISPQVRTMQVIVVGFAASPIVFAVMAHLLPQPALNADAQTLLVRVALVVGLLGLVGQDVAQRVVASQAAKVATKAGANDPVRLAGAYLSAILVSSGIAEAAAMICLLAYWMTRDQMTFAMAVLLVIANLMKYPTPARVAAWAAGQMKQQ